MPPSRLRALLPGLVFLLGLLLAPSAAIAQRQPEFLGRGIIALRGVDTGGNGTNNWGGSGANQVYLGWRLLATDPEAIGFNVYRSANGGAPVKLTASPVTASTNYIDATATLSLANTYHVRPVVAGVEGAASEVWTLPANSTAQPCFTIPMPALPDGAHYVHLAWPGDLDGDGHTDIVVDRLPTEGGTIRVEGYSTAARARLWTIDLGPNSAGLISAGQNDGVTVFDFDGDGRCEVITKSVAGTVFGDGSVATGDGVYLSVVEGSTGRELARRQIATGIGSANDANDAKNIGVAFLDGVRPGLIVLDGAKDFSAYDIHPATFALSLRWKLDSPGNPYPHGHGIRIGDLDGDGRDEVSDLAMAIDDNGSLLFQNELNHGDRYHIADIDPDRPGLECFAVQQDNPTQLNYVLFDALTGQMLWRKYASTMVDNGRGNLGSIDSRFTGQQMWSASGGVLVDHHGNPVGDTQPGSCNFSLWWDADLLRETLNRQLVDKWGGGRLLTGYNFEGATYSWRDAVPFYGDILGDWREEIVTDNGAGTRLVIFSTTRAATSRHYTLLQDPQYRADLTLKGYMQSHHPGFYFGQNMPRAPRAPVWAGDLAWVGSASANTWDKSSARWKTSAAGAATSAFADGQSVLFDLTGVSSVPVTLAENLAPSAVVVHAAKNQSYTFAGPGSLTGAMTLTKAGQGTLTLSGSHAYTGATVVNEGSLFIDGQLSGGAIRVDSRGILGGTGTITSAVSMSELRAALAPGRLGVPGTLALGGGLALASQSVVHLDLAATPAAANDRVAITGNLSSSGANIVYLQLNLLDGALAPGATYTLFTYTGSFTGQLGAFALRGAEAFPCTLADTGSAITLTVGNLRPAATVTWAGGAANAWTLGTGTGWLKDTGADAFVTGDAVRFGGTGAGVILPGLVFPSSTLVDAATDYTFTGPGGIGGSGGLTKSGPGTLTLSTVNTYTGPTVINGGVVSVASISDGGQPGPLGAASASPANLVLNGGTLRLSGGSASTFRGATLGAAGGTLDLPSASSVLNLGGTFTGPGALTKTGSGLLILNAVNTHSGGTVIQAGKVVLTASREDYSPTSSIQYGLGSGPVTLQGGTLSLSDTSQGDLDHVDSRAFWPVVVPAGATARLEANGRMQLGGALTGAGDLTFRTPYVRTDITGNWSAFTGRLFVIADGDGGDFRIANSAGLAGAWLDLAANVYAYSRAGSGLTTMNIGSLSGAAGSVLNAGTGGGLGANQPAHWRIGARGDDTTFAGSIRGTSVVTKRGPGTLTLSGASTHTGATTVSAGKLVLAGGSLSGSAVTVQGGAGFGGPGSVTGNVAFDAGSVLLTNPASGPLAVIGDLAFGGAVTVAPVPGAVLAPGSYPLFTYSGALAGAPAFAWSSPGLSATFDTSVPGQVTMTLAPTILPPSNLVVLPGDAHAALSWDPSADAVAYTVRRAASPAGPYVVIAAGLAGLDYLDTGLANGSTYFYLVTAVAADGGSADSDPVGASIGPLPPYAHWRLDESVGATAADSSAQGLHGALAGAPAWTPGRINNGLNLASASGQHVALPTGVVSSLGDFTISLWARMTTLAGWARLVDFGTGTNNYLFITPQTGGSNLLRFAIRTPSVPEQVINGAAALPAGVWSHVAVTLSGSTGTLYLNGVEVGSNSAMTLTPASLGATTQNYLGRSQFSADPFLNGALDEFQIYARALTPGEVAALAAPPAAPGGLDASAGVAAITLDWNTVADATGYSIHRAATAGGPYATLASNVTATTFTDARLTPGTPHHYVVTALKGVAESARSAPASATPLSPLQDWRLTHFGSADSAGDADDLADPDGDGLPNLLEYALGADPQAPGSGPVLQVSGLGPQPSYLQITFHRVADPALAYAVEAASGLSPVAWDDIWTSTGADNTAGPVTVTDPEPLSAHPRRFLRLRVSIPAP